MRFASPRAALVIAGLLVAEAFADESRPLDPGDRSERLRALYQLLTITFIVLLAFFVGSYVILRARRLAAQPGLTRRTRYVDAWGAYRLSQEAIDAATRDAEDPPRTNGPNDHPA